MLALPWKITLTQAAIIACTKGSAIISTSILINFGGIVSTPTAFSTSISFKSFLNSRAFVCWILKLFKSEPNLFLNFKTLGWLWHLFYLYHLPQYLYRLKYASINV